MARTPRRNDAVALAHVAQFVGTPSCTMEGCEFDSQLRHIPGLWVGSLVRVQVGGNQLIFFCLSKSNGDALADVA